MTVPYLQVTASPGADVPDSIELHNRQTEMHWEVELLEKLQAAGVVVRRQDSGGTGKEDPLSMICSSRMVHGYIRLSGTRKVSQVVS